MEKILRNYRLNQQTKNSKHIQTANEKIAHLKKKSTNLPKRDFRIRLPTIKIDIK